MSDWRKQRKTGVNVVWRKTYLDMLFDGHTEHQAFMKAEKAEQKHWKGVRIRNKVFIQHTEFVEKELAEIMKLLRKPVLPRIYTKLPKKFQFLGRLQVCSFTFPPRNEDEPATHPQIKDKSAQWDQQSQEIAKPSKFNKDLSLAEQNTKGNSHALIGDINILELKIKGEWNYKTSAAQKKQELITQHKNKLALLKIEAKRVSELKDKEKARFARYFFIQIAASEEFEQRKYK